MKSPRTTPVLLALCVLVVALALTDLLRPPESVQSDRNIGPTNTLSVDNVAEPARQQAVPATSPITSTQPEAVHGSGNDSRTTPAKPNVSIAEGAMATQRIPDAEWQEIRKRSGLSITPRRQFIVDPLPVRVAFAPLRAARNREVSRLQFDLGLTHPVVAEVTTVVEHSDDAFTFAGKIDGDPLSEFSVSIYEDAVVGTFSSGEFGIRQLRYVGDEIHKVEGIDDAFAPQCAEPLSHELAAASDDRRTLAKSDEHIASADNKGNAAPPADDGFTNSPPSATAGNTVLDVLVAYTPASIANEGSLNALLALINQGVVDTNVAFQASNIEATLRLVGTAQVSYNGTRSGPMLTALSSTTDGSMDSIHDIRDDLAADFVSLWAPLSDYCGLAYRMTAMSTGFAEIAFNVCDPDCQFKFTFTHELGHLFGSHHAVGDAGLARGGSILFPHSYGWRWHGTNGTRYRSIMAYSPGIPVRRFSDPDIRYQGTFAGREDKEDNARSIKAALSTLEQFRGTTDDHGNDAATATSVTSTSNTSGTIEVSPDVDWFKFTVTTTTSITIESVASTDVAARLRNSAETIIAADNDNGVSDNFLISTTLNPGTYFIEVFGENGDTGGYSLVLDTSGSDDHGNTLSTATPVGAPGSSSGSIEVAGDGDLFRFEVPVAGTIHLASNGSTDTFGTLLSRFGATIESDNDSGNGQNFTISRVISSGIHYIRVRGATGSVTGGYFLNIGFTAIPDDHGDTLSTATAVATPGSSSGVIEIANDRDLFRFEVPVAGTLHLTTNGSTDTYGTLLNYFGMAIESDDDSGDDDNFSILRIVSSGVHYIRVSGATGAVTGDYSLNIGFTATPDDHGDTFSEATITTPGSLLSPESIEGEFETAGDIDFFRFTIADENGIRPDTANGAEAVVIDMEGPPAQPSGSSWKIAIYQEDGFTLKPPGPVATAPPYDMSRTGSGNASSPDNGGAYLKPDPGHHIEITRDGSLLFDALHVDLAEYSTVFNTPQSITWRGYRTDGTSVAHTFTTDGIIDGAGGNADFETFSFPSNFIELVELRAESTDAHYHFDNLSVKPSQGETLPTGELSVYSSGSTDTIGALYDSTFQLLNNADDGGSGANFAINREVLPGTFYIAVSEAGNNDTGNYTLALGYKMDPRPPYPPTGLTASDDDQNGVQLTWNPSSNTDTYSVYRSDSDNRISATLLTDSIVSPDYFDATSAAGQSYYYWVSASNEEGESSDSLSASGYRTYPKPTITEQPANIGVQPGEAATFSVTATANQGSLHYQWYLGPRGNTSAPVGTDSATLTFPDTTTATRVWVRVSDDLEWVDSASAIASLLLPPPAEVSAFNGLLTSGVMVRWHTVADISNYAVYRNITDTPIGADLIGTTDALSFLDSSASPGQDYYYFVRSVNIGGFEGDSGGGGSGGGQRNLGSLAAGPLDGALLPLRNVVDFGYSGDSSEFFIASESGWIDQYSIDAKQIVNSVGLGAYPGGLDVDGTGQRVMVAQRSAQSGQGTISKISFADGAVQIQNYTIPLVTGETGIFDIVYLTNSRALITTEAPGAASRMYQLNPFSGDLSLREDAPTSDGESGQPIYFAKLVTRSGEGAGERITYFNDFEDANSAFDHFQNSQRSGASIENENGQLRIDLGGSTAATASASLRISDALPEFNSRLSANTSKITWAFNLSHADNGANNAVKVSIGDLNNVNHINGPGHYIKAYELRAGNMIGDQMVFRRTYAPQVSSPAVDHFTTDAGLSNLPRIGAFRITYDPATAGWEFYFEQSTTKIDPLSITDLFGSVTDSTFTDNSLSYLNFFSSDLGGVYVDDLTVIVENYFQQASQVAVFQGGQDESGWFSHEESGNSFGDLRAHPGNQVSAAVNSVDTQFAIADGTTTKVYRQDGTELASLPVSGGVSFSPSTDQVYIADATSGKLHIFSTEDWTEDYAIAIEGGIGSASGNNEGRTFGQGKIEVRPDGQQLAIACLDGIRFVDLTPYLPNAPPLAPIELTASNSNPDLIGVYWSPAVGAISYSVYRSNSDDFATATLIAEDLTDLDYLDTEATFADATFYWITARNAFGEGSATPSVAGRRIINLPYLVTTTTEISNQVAVSWRYNGSTSEGDFEIFRSTTDDIGTANAIGSTASTTFSDFTAQDGVAYYYWIRKRFTPFVGDFAGPQRGHRQLAAPQNALATNDLGSGVVVSWDAIPSSIPFQYAVYSGTQFQFNGSERLVGLTTETTITDPWTNFDADKPFYWFVRAMTTDAVGSISNGAFGRRLIIPPGNVTASDESPAAIHVAWDHLQDGQTGYRVHRSLSSNFTEAVQMADLPTSDTTFVDAGTLSNISYYYWITGYSSAQGMSISEISAVATGVRLATQYSDYKLRFGLTEENNSLNGDPDQDGHATILEWGLGGSDPLNSNSEPQLHWQEMAIAGKKYLSLSYLRIVDGTETGDRYEALNLRYRAEGSVKLDQWTLTPVAVEPPVDLPAPPPGYEWGCFRLPGSIDQDPKGFVRLRLSVTPP